MVGRGGIRGAAVFWSSLPATTELEAFDVPRSASRVINSAAHVALRAVHGGHGLAPGAGVGDLCCPALAAQEEDAP